MIRKKVTATLVLALLIGGSGAWAQAQRFPDHKDFAAIEYLAANGWFVGYGDGTFRPEHTISAAQAASTKC